jgi:hypothetical protein
MSTVLGTIQWDAFLKELYPDGLPQEVMMRKHSFMTKVEKSTEATGEYMVVPVTVDGPSGRSATIATLLDATVGPIGPTTSVKFNVTLASDYGATWIDELTILKAANDRGSFVNARKFEIDGVLRRLGDSLAHALYRAGDGTVGRGDGAYSVAGNVITLLNRADTKFFGMGMVLDFIANNSGVPAALRIPAVAGVRPKISKIDEDAGTLTCATDTAGGAIAALSTTITAAANTDWFAPVGDYSATWATTGALKVRGLAAWVPLVAPAGGDNFYGADRSIWPTRLAGHRLNDPTAPAEDSIMALAEVMRERGASPDTVFVSPRQFTKISKRLNAKVEYNGAGGDAKYGFMSFGIATSAGILPVFVDSDCPEDRGYILNMETWSLRHLGGLPDIVSTDGNTALRRAGLDQIEIRARYYAQLLCKAPAENGVFAVS